MTETSEGQRVEEERPGVGLGEECLRCGKRTSYMYAVTGGGILCPPCVALVDPERYGGTHGEWEHTVVKAERSDEEWEAMGWKRPATVTALAPNPTEERDQDSGDSFDARIRHAQKRGAGAVVEQLRKEKVQAEIRTRDKEKKQQ